MSLRSGWGAIWLFSPLLGFVLWLIAHRAEVRRAAQVPYRPGRRPDARAVSRCGLGQRLPRLPPSGGRRGLVTCRPALHHAGRRGIPPGTPGHPTAEPAPCRRRSRSRGRRSRPCRRRSRCRGRRSRPGGRRRAPPLAPGVAPRSERPVPLPVVDGFRVDVLRLGARPCGGRHQPGPAHRALLELVSGRPGSS